MYTRGSKKPTDGGSKSNKYLKSQGKDPLRDMLNYAQKWSRAFEAELVDDGKATLHLGCEDQAQAANALLHDTNIDDALGSWASLLLDPGVDEPEQPTLVEILWAVTKCTASVYNLKDQFGGLREEVSWRQDLQKICEQTMAVKSRVSDIEDQLPPLTRETGPTIWIIICAATMFALWVCLKRQRGETQ